MTIQTSDTIRFDIFIAGDLAQVKQVCREHCMAVGLCVTVEPVTYIYTGGEESGVRVGLINYPRFPSTHDDLLAKAQTLAALLMERLCQHSYSIVGPHLTEWHSRRPGAEPRARKQIEPIFEIDCGAPSSADSR
jgi:hypothetical protein